MLTFTASDEATQNNLADIISVLSLNKSAIKTFTLGTGAAPSTVAALTFDTEEIGTNGDGDSAEVTVKVTLKGTNITKTLNLKVQDDE